jgi:hypothetical protein
MASPPRVLPVLDDEVPLAEADPRGQWTRAGQNYVWSRFVAAGGATLELFERIGDAVVRVPVVDRAVHVIPTGRPYRLQHVYGFWRATGADTVYLRTPAPGGNAYMLITGTSYDTYTEDRIFWTCAKCGRELDSLTIPKSSGLNGLLKQTAKAVRDFNGDPAKRTCPACATVHPPAYGMDVPADDNLEASARREW